MAVILGELPNMVFRRVEKKNIGEFSIDNRMLTVLINLDGKKTIGEIAFDAGVTMEEMKINISKLLEIGIVEPAEEKIPILDREFIRYLKLQLSQIVGPIADILIEDAADTLGYDPMRVPRHRAAELVDLLAREISDREKRTFFTKNMVEKISSVL